MVESAGIPGVGRPADRGGQPDDRRYRRRRLQQGRGMRIYGAHVRRRTSAPAGGSSVSAATGAMNWLIKEEPAHYSFDDLVRDGRTVWSGVRNPLAQKHLQSMRKGDSIFFYHTGDV